MPRLAALLLLLLPSAALAVGPLETVEDSLRVPAGMDAAEALATVEDLTHVFGRYEPVIPWVPGVTLDLTKEIVSLDSPTVMALPVEGKVFGRAITERAQVTASTEPMTCGIETPGLMIHLSFEGSSHNVSRRIERIEITACPREGDDGELYIDATGGLYEGPLPRDPDLNAFNENLGAKALQGAFLKQVPAVFEAVERAWADRQILAATSAL